MKKLLVYTLLPALLFVVTIVSFSSCSDDDDKNLVSLPQTEDTATSPDNDQAGTLVNIGTAVNLGLPSGLKWASCNVGAAAPEEYGGYYAWGETEEKSDYSWGSYKYCNGTGDTMTKYSINENNGIVDGKTSLDSEDDVVTAIWGASWRMPTKVEQDELRDNCTWVWTTLNGVNGYNVIGPNGNSIFFPAAGYRSGAIISGESKDGYYWSSTCSDNGSDNSSFLYFDNSFATWGYGSRCSGRSVRPVYCETAINYTVTISSSGKGSVAINSASCTTAIIEEGDNVTITAIPEDGAEFVGWYTSDGVTLVNTSTTYTFAVSASIELVAKFNTIVTPEEPPTDDRAIDLGLPSGLKWASCNVGATAPEEYGDYYAWGETEEDSDYSYSWGSYIHCKGSSTTLTKYCTESYYGIVDDKIILDSEDDAATVLWGGKWRMPTKEELEELVNNCTWEWTTLNGIKGYRITGTNGNNIFLPTAGYYSDARLRSKGSNGCYWSSSSSGSASYNAYCLDFNKNGSNIYDNKNRRYGFSVRPVWP